MSPLEERSKIRYYELPSLPTFAKKILSIRAQSELEQGDAIRLKITRTTRPRRGPHVPRRTASVSQLGAIQSEAGKMLALRGGKGEGQSLSAGMGGPFLRYICKIP